MNKLFLVALIIVSAFAFNIKRQNIVSETQLKAINWPFTTCGDGRWKIEKLTLSAQPARNTNDSIVVVIYIFYNLFSWVQLKILLHSNKLF